MVLCLLVKLKVGRTVGRDQVSQRSCECKMKNVELKMKEIIERDDQVWVSTVLLSSFFTPYITVH